MRNFSIGDIAPSIILPLRYYFSKYSNGASFKWDPDEKQRTIDIYEALDSNRIPLQEKPRIVVSRGGFSIDKTGLSDNLATMTPWAQTKGVAERSNFVMYRGQSTILIEARTKGACELLSDMTAHFLIWSRPIICDVHDWKEFGLPMSVSDCSLAGGEDPNVDKYQVQISIPWIKEERWVVRNEGPELKKVLLNAYVPT